MNTGQSTTRVNAWFLAAEKAVAAPKESSDVPEHETQALIDFFATAAAAIVATVLVAVGVVVLFAGPDELAGFVPPADVAVLAGDLEFIVPEAPTFGFPATVVAVTPASSAAAAIPVSESATPGLTTVPVTAPLWTESLALLCVELHPLTAKHDRSAAINSRCLR